MLFPLAPLCSVTFLTLRAHDDGYRLPISCCFILGLSTASRSLSAIMSIAVLDGLLHHNASVVAFECHAATPWSMRSCKVLRCALARESDVVLVAAPNVMRLSHVQHIDARRILVQHQLPKLESATTFYTMTSCHVFCSNRESLAVACDTYS